MSTRKLYTDWDKVPLVLDTGQAALVLPYDPEYIARLCAKGKLPGKQADDGGSWLIEKDVLRTWLKERKDTP